MKLTKTEWKKLNDRVLLTLRPTQYPVAMKFIRTQEEFDEIPNIIFGKNKATLCKTLGMASHFQGTFGITTDGFTGPYCCTNNGCMAPQQEWREGSILYREPTVWHHEQEDARKHIAENEKMLPETPYLGVVCSSLSDCDIQEPDVIALQLPSQAAFHLLAGYVESGYEKLNFTFSGESNCADTWMYTVKTGKPGLSLGCRGDRATGGLGDGEVRVTMTAEQLITALDGADRIEKNGISYPYYPVCMVKDNF